MNIEEFLRKWHFNTTLGLGTSITKFVLKLDDGTLYMGGPEEDWLAFIKYVGEYEEKLIR